MVENYTKTKSDYVKNDDGVGLLNFYKKNIDNLEGMLNLTLDCF